MSALEIIRGKKHWLTVMQVVDRDPDGKPRGYRILYDNETLDVGKAADEGNANFILVWTPLDQNANEQSMAGLVAEMEQLRGKQAELQALRTEQDRDLRRIEGEVTRLEADTAKKTEELRRLQRERDPERIAREVADQVAAQTAVMRAELTTARAAVATLTEELRGAQASKKKLREALERERSAK
jgi:hypothetical protein